MNKPTESKKKYVIARCYHAGVHAGELVSNKCETVILKNARRIWFWKGAASLSELAVYGAKYPDECKFGVPVPEITLNGCCELIQTCSKGEKMIRGCKEWRA